MEKTGITGASLYNAFGDKRALYQRALDHYVEDSVVSRSHPPLRGAGAARGNWRLLRRSSGDRSTTTSIKAACL